MAKDIIVYECPRCGSNKHWVDSENYRHRKCRNCGTEFEIDKKQDVEPQILKEPDPEKLKQAQEEPDQISEILEKQVPPPKQKISTFDFIGGCVLIIFMLAFVGFLVRAIAINNADWEAREALITTIGEYEVGYLDCQEERVLVEYGEEGEESVASVYVGDRWSVSPEIQDFMKDVIDSVQRRGYLWIHCENSEKEPGYFAIRFPLPQDEMRVVMRDK